MIDNLKVTEDTIENIIKNKTNARCDIGLKDMLKEYYPDTKKNKSFMSILMFKTEVFIGEINYDISSFSINELSSVFRYIEEKIKDLLSEVTKYEVLPYECKFRWRYVVKPHTQGECMAGDLHIHIYNNNSPVDMSCSSTLELIYSYFDKAWLLYWEDKRQYFKN